MKLPGWPGSGDEECLSKDRDDLPFCLPDTGSGGRNMYRDLADWCHREKHKAWWPLPFIRNVKLPRFRQAGKILRPACRISCELLDSQTCSSRLLSPLLALLAQAGSMFVYWPQTCAGTSRHGLVAGRAVLNRSFGDDTFEGGTHP